MIETQTTLTKLDPLFKCQDRPWIAVEEKKHLSSKQKIDRTIARKVDRAMWKDRVLRGTAYGKIDVHVANGIVTLVGHVVSAMNQWRVERAVNSVPGVLGISDRLVEDDQLAVDVASSLAWIEQLYGEKFFTGVQNGVVVLSGTVSSGKIRDLAEHTAAGNPNVRGIINCVRAPGIDLSTEDVRFIQPVIGERIAFSDGLSGTVEQVIINPDNRRVVGMTLRGRFLPKSARVGAAQGNDDRTPIGLVVIPVNSILALTQTSGMLSMASSDSSQVQVFERANYFIPKSGWIPPFPYCPAEVLLSGEVHAEMAHPENAPALTPLWAPGTKIRDREAALT
jgi:osmotically-inducible protein OsmY